VEVHPLHDSDAGTEIVRLAPDGKYDLLIVGLASATAGEQTPAVDVPKFVRNVPCQVFLASPPRHSARA
jgi:hypothetical protein